MDAKLVVRDTLIKIGVEVNRVSTGGRVDIRFDPEKISIETIYNALAEAGYPAFGKPKFIYPKRPNK
jgi:hypothetical protein